MKILTIETSCDDTGVAILEYDKTGQPKILADLVSSQIKVHAPWGGVVPSLAKREHQKNLVPLLIKALKQSSLSCHPERSEGSKKDSSLRSYSIQNDKKKTGALKQILDREPELLKKLPLFLKKYAKPDIDYIAVTHGPGLEPALWVGVNLARALSYFWDIPLIPVNHIEGHLCANLASDGDNAGHKLLATSSKLFPAIGLVVSGGHTQLILIKKIGSYQIVGETRDDAAGEAFDKVAKMLNLGYPGGPIISQIAKSYKLKAISCKLPRPMLNSGDFDFSFSGLKTAVLYALQKMTPAQIKKQTPAIAAEFQQAVIDVLAAKTLSAVKKYGAKTLLLAGGVAANPRLRESLAEIAEREAINFLMPPLNLCMDNAAMIALAAYWQIKQKRAKNTIWRVLKAQANLRIS